mmetsp:Transcript_78598/g.163332  ORF Transcript_78598/g.163332 Transcript_78598/m.163332 type:complete len:269 (-) Transcript_78598:404-1210(-)
MGCGFPIDSLLAIRRFFACRLGQLSHEFSVCRRQDCHVRISLSGISLHLGMGSLRALGRRVASFRHLAFAFARTLLLMVVRSPGAVVIAGAFGTFLVLPLGGGTPALWAPPIALIVFAFSWRAFPRTHAATAASSGSSVHRHFPFSTPRRVAGPASRTPRISVGTPASQCRNSPLATTLAWRWSPRSPVPLSSTMILLLCEGHRVATSLHEGKQSSQGRDDGCHLTCDPDSLLSHMLFLVCRDLAPSVLFQLTDGGSFASDDAGDRIR